MAYTLYLDKIKHDLVIENGTFKMVSGEDEIIQRVKIALWHHLGEFFLNTADGTPWHEEILGRRSNAGVASSIIRSRILSVDGVTGIRDFKVSFDSFTREYTVISDINVRTQAGVTTVNLNFALSPEQ